MNNARPQQGHILRMLLLMAILTESTPVSQDLPRNQTNPTKATDLKHQEPLWQHRSETTWTPKSTTGILWDWTTTVGNLKTTQTIQQTNSTVTTLLGEPLAPERGTSTMTQNFETSTTFSKGAGSKNSLDNVIVELSSLINTTVSEPVTTEGKIRPGIVLEVSTQSPVSDSSNRTQNSTSAEEEAPKATVPLIENTKYQQKVELPEELTTLPEPSSSTTFQDNPVSVDSIQYESSVTRPDVSNSSSIIQRSTTTRSRPSVNTSLEVPEQYSQILSVTNAPETTILNNETVVSHLLSSTIETQNSSMISNYPMTESTVLIDQTVELTTSKPLQIKKTSSLKTTEMPEVFYSNVSGTTQENTLNNEKAFPSLTTTFLTPSTTAKSTKVSNLDGTELPTTVVSVDTVDKVFLGSTNERKHVTSTLIDQGESTTPNSLDVGSTKEIDTEIILKQDFDVKRVATEYSTPAISNFKETENSLNVVTQTIGSTTTKTPDLSTKHKNHNITHLTTIITSASKVSESTISYKLALQTSPIPKTPEFLTTTSSVIPGKNAQINDFSPQSTVSKVQEPTILATTESISVETIDQNMESTLETLNIPTPGITMATTTINTFAQKTSKDSANIKTEATTSLSKENRELSSSGTVSVSEISNNTVIITNTTPLFDKGVCEDTTTEEPITTLSSVPEFNTPHQTSTEKISSNDLTTVVSYPLSSTAETQNSSKTENSMISNNPLTESIVLIDQSTEELTTSKPLEIKNKSSLKTTEMPEVIYSNVTVKTRENTFIPTEETTTQILIANISTTMSTPLSPKHNISSIAEITSQRLPISNKNISGKSMPLEINNTTESRTTKILESTSSYPVTIDNVDELQKIQITTQTPGTAETNTESQKIYHFINKDPFGSNNWTTPNPSNTSTSMKIKQTDPTKFPNPSVDSSSTQILPFKQKQITSTENFEGYTQINHMKLPSTTLFLEHTTPYTEQTETTTAIISHDRKHTTNNETQSEKGKQKTNTRNNKKLTTNLVESGETRLTNPVFYKNKTLTQHERKSKAKFNIKTAKSEPDGTTTSTKEPTKTFRFNTNKINFTNTYIPTEDVHPFITKERTPGKDIKQGEEKTSTEQYKKKIKSTITRLKSSLEKSTKSQILSTSWPISKVEINTKVHEVTNIDPLNPISKAHFRPTKTYVVRKQNFSLPWVDPITKEQIVTTTIRTYTSLTKSKEVLRETQLLSTGKSTDHDPNTISMRNNKSNVKNKFQNSRFPVISRNKTSKIQRIKNRKTANKIIVLKPHQREGDKSQESKKESSKNKINHIEEILRKYYEEFENRNTQRNNNEQKYPRKSPIKRKFKNGIRAEPNEKRKDSSPMCFVSVLNRRYLNSSHSSMSFVNKERLINYRSLEYLDLSHNNLARFNVSTLNNLNTLKYIALEYNNLTDLYPINFYTLRNLEFLNLSNNNISRIRNFTFIHMKSLKYLNLQGNAITKINATTFKGLQGLLYLDLSRNEIEYLHEECMPKILKIKYFNLSHNKISSLAISNLKNIQYVDLSHNQIWSFNNISLGNMPNQMKVLKINDNLLEHLNENIFKNFSRLIYLDVSNNKLNYISPSTFQYLDNLIFLNVSCQNILPQNQKGATYLIDEESNESTNQYSKVGSSGKTKNRINFPSYSYDISRNGGIKRVNDSNNVQNSKTLKNGEMGFGSNQKSQKSKSKLLTADVQKQTKQSIGNRIRKRTNLQNKNKTKLKLLDNTQYVVKQKRGRNENRKKTIQPIPDIIDFKLNLLASISQRLKQFECINVNIKQVPKVLTHSIQILNLKLNKIKIIQLGDLDDYPLLQILILSNNKIKSIETDSLGRLDFLKVLLMDNNKLKYVPISLPESIEILNMNFNIISRIGQEDFFDMVNLEKLYLHGNKIDNIPPNTFMFLRNLKYLDLSNNPIKKITSITLNKLNFINLSDLRNIEFNVTDRFPIEDGYSLIGIKLNNSTALCHLLQQDDAFVLTLKQIKYLNCNQSVESKYTMPEDTRNNLCENNTKYHKSKMLNTLATNSNPSNTKFMNTRRIMGLGQINECINNESNASPARNYNYNTVRKRSNIAYSKTINSNLTVNNILVNVNKCTICKVDSVYEPSFVFTPVSVNNYIVNIVSFEDELNYTQASTYYKHILEEQQANCLHRGNGTRDKMPGNARNTDVNIENYTSMNNSTDVLIVRTKGNTGSFRNRGTTSTNKIFMENSSENNGIFVITKDSDIPSREFPHDFHPRDYSKVRFRERKNNVNFLRNMDYAMNDQPIMSEHNKNETESNKTNKEVKGEKLSQLGEENKFSIVRDSKKNVILKLNRNINNETEEKLTENYDQLEIKEPTKITYDNEYQGSNAVSSEQSFLIRGNKTFMDIKNNSTSIQSREHDTRKLESIKRELTKGKMGGDEKLIAIKSKSPKGKFYEAVKSNQEHSDISLSIKKTIKFNPSENNENEKNKSRKSTQKIDYGILRSSESNNGNKDSQINQIKSYLKNYQSINNMESESDYNQFKNTDNVRLGDELEHPSLHIHKDAQYEMNIVDTDAEFLDIDDKTENTINDNTIRTLETSKYHELVSENTTEGMAYHTGMIIFLMIVVFMIVGAFLALTFQWNSLLHSYCHHYVSYRNNGPSDDDGNTSDSNFDRIEMLDNVDVYSIA